MQATYTDIWYAKQYEDTEPSARVISALVCSLIKPESAIDLGCGVGTWLCVLQDLGVSDVLGVDGPWVNSALLKIREDQFLRLDLRDASVTLKRKFDLVLCLEVAEHLPEGRANTLVQTLVNLGPIVLFSAAVPFQGGCNHVNEQWQDYWTKRFEEHGFVVIDCIRKRVWDNPAVLVHYKQNTLLFASGDALKENDALREEYNACRDHPIAVVHPELYTIKQEHWSSLDHLALRHIVASIPRRILRAVAHRLRRTPK